MNLACQITNGYTNTVGSHAAFFVIIQCGIQSHNHQNVYLFKCGPQIGLPLLVTMDCPSDREDLRRPRLKAQLK